ncbi:MAG: 50S ribosomal protein L24 [bacterium]
MNIKKNDKILMISGKYKGKTGNVSRALPKEGKIVVDKINVYKKHIKSRVEGKKGEIVEKSMPFDASKAKLICSKCGKPTRAGKKVLESGKRVRICKKCGEEI